MKTAAIVVGIIVTICVIGLWYFGGFVSIDVKNSKAGGFLVAGIENIGPYDKVGPVMAKSDSLLRSLHIACDQGIGIYYDNPRVIPKAKCRSFLGFVLSNLSVIDSITHEAILNKGMKFLPIENKDAIIAEFPIKNIFSYMIGPMRAYPKLIDYQSKHHIKPTKMFEIYDLKAKKIVFVMQYAK